MWSLCSKCSRKENIYGRFPRSTTSVFSKSFIYGNVNVSVFYHDETFWLTQKAMGELFGTSKQSISYHLNNVFKEELNKNSVVKEFLTTASDGKNYETLFYNLDAIIAVGYRINSKQATKFRQWATATLREHMGLTTWKNAPAGKILKSDVTVSKNYLSQEELSGLNDVVNMYLDYAEPRNYFKRNNGTTCHRRIRKISYHSGYHLCIRF